MLQGHWFSLLASLRWRFSLAIALVALLCTVICVATAVLFLQQTLTGRATSDLRRTITGVSGYLDNQRNDLLGTARLVADDPGVQQDLEGNNREAMVVRLTPFYADLNTDVMDVINANGRVLVRMEDTSSYGDVVQDRPSVRVAFSGRSVVAPESDLPDTQAAGGYGLRATVPVRPYGATIGLVVVGRQLDSTFAGRISRAVDADVNLIAGGQRTGTTLTDSHGLPATGVAVAPAILRRIRSGVPSVAVYTEDGHRVLSGLVPLRGADGAWAGAVEVVRPLDSLYDVITQLTILLCVLGAIVVLGALFLALYAGRRLTVRLSSLESTASRVAAMAEGDQALDQFLPSDEVRGHDEVASLARSLRSMMQALDNRMAANDALYAAAQARVHELSGLAEIARLLTAGPSVRETIDLLGEHVCRLVGASAVAIWLPGDGTLPALYGGHGLPDEYDTLTRDAITVSGGTPFETAAQIVLRTGQPVHASLVNDRDVPGLLESHAALQRLIRSSGANYAMAVPLRVQGRIVGALTCYTQVQARGSEGDQSLLSTIADQVAVAVENARLYERSRELAALEERQRLARELHDSVSQALYGIALGAQTAKALLAIDHTRVSEPLDYVLTQADAGLTEMRALIFELRPEALATEGLVAVLDQQIVAARTRHGLEIKSELSVSEPDVPFVVKETLYRIAQEALHNTVKHARAHTVRVHLAWDADGVALEISDDGTGFDTSGEFPGHLGLKTMAERATRLGGVLDIRSAPGAGTSVRVWIPSGRVAGSRPSMELAG